MVLKCRCCLLSSLQVFERLDEHDQLAELHEEEELIGVPLQTQPADPPGQYYLQSDPSRPFCGMIVFKVVGCSQCLSGELGDPL